MGLLGSLPVPSSIHWGIFPTRDCLMETFPVDATQYTGWATPNFKTFSLMPKRTPGLLPHKYKRRERICGMGARSYGTFSTNDLCTQKAAGGQNASGQLRGDGMNFIRTPFLRLA